MSTESSPSGCARGADDELGGAAADVDDEVRRGLGQTGGRAEELEAGFLVAAEQLGPHAEQLLGRVEELVAVARVARRAGGRGTHAGHAVLVDHVAVLARATASVRAIASGSSRRVWSTPWPSRVICVRRSIVTSGVVTVGDLGDEQPRRVRADVDGGDAGHSPSPAARRSETQRPTGSSPPARKQA